MAGAAHPNIQTPLNRRAMEDYAAAEGAKLAKRVVLLAPLVVACKGNRNCLQGTRFVVTGWLEAKQGRRDRDETKERLERVVRAFGGSLQRSPKQSTDYGLCGPWPGPKKLALMRQHGVTQIDEAGLLELVGRLPAQAPARAAPFVQQPQVLKGTARDASKAAGQPAPAAADQGKVGEAAALPKGARFCLSGKRFALIGSWQHVGLASRKELTKLITEHGGLPAKVISHEIQYHVFGRMTNPQDAQEREHWDRVRAQCAKHGVEQIDAQQLFELIRTLPAKRTMEMFREAKQEPAGERVLPNAHECWGCDLRASAAVQLLACSHGCGRAAYCTPQCEASVRTIHAHDCATWREADLTAVRVALTRAAAPATPPETRCSTPPTPTTPPEPHTPPTPTTPPEPCTPLTPMADTVRLDADAGAPGGDVEWSVSGWGRLFAWANMCMFRVERRGGGCTPYACVCVAC